MAEIVEVYDLEGDLLALQDRKEFEKEIKAEYKDTKKITRKLKAIRLMLLNSDGRIYLQYRARNKKSNPGLLDKSIGGHVKAGDSYALTVVKECAEELGFPAALVEKEEYRKAYRTTDLSTVGIFYRIDLLEEFLSIRVSSNGQIIEQPYMTGMYVGYYDGPISFVDGESQGVMSYSMDELKFELEENPNNFTEDLKFMVANYSEYLVPLKKSAHQKKYTLTGLKNELNTNPEEFDDALIALLQSKK